VSLKDWVRDIWQELPEPALLRWSSLFFTLCAVTFVISIAACQTFLTLAGVCYAIDLLRRPRAPSFPRVKLPLALYCLFTVLSMVFAANPAAGGNVVRKLTLFIIMLLAVNVVASYRLLVWIWRAIFVESAMAGLVAAGQFVLQYQETRAAHPGQIYYYMTLTRIRGFMGHWMTFGGQQMLVFAALAACLLLGAGGARAGTGSRGLAQPPGPRPASRAPSGRFWWLAAAVIALSIVLNFTRGVWIGCGAALFYLVARWRARLLWSLPVLAMAAYLSAPSLVRDRVASLIHPSADPSVTARFEMWHVGLAMIRTHPVVGVGPNNIDELYLTYLRPGTYEPSWHEHMHDNFLQLAAERGLPCLAAWLWFMGALAWQILGIRRRLKSEGRPFWIADASLAAWLAFVTEGVFEFNFGTSPVLMLFLFVVSAPYAADGLRRLWHPGRHASIGWGSPGNRSL
jgi:putative inorganic carbon (hco3(-)) transporter